MLEGALSGAVLLGATEATRQCLLAAAPLPGPMVGFLAGAAGGASQAVVMAPCSLLVTAATAETGRGESVSVMARRIWKQGGVASVYRGAGAVAARQASNWASRQGLTELIRPLVSAPGPLGEVVSGCLAGCLSAWNTPFEVARIEAQASAYVGGSVAAPGRGLWATLRQLKRERGTGGLFCGLGPRMCQACYQTVFMVCIPRILDIQ